MGNTNKLAKGTKENSPPSKYNRRKTEPRPSPTTLRGIVRTIDIKILRNSEKIFLLGGIHLYSQ
jgi:hypothetical protein